ncbi:MAG TPA: helix-turn-helix domain-containing protein [Solirubrobacteraceae bacterium]|jgi:CRP-like cAMP-binding protein
MATRTISLLDEDPDLAGGLTGDRLAAARREILCEVLELSRGPLDDHPGMQSTDGALGLLVLDGLLSRRTAVAGRRCLELLGSGDLLRPWQNDGQHSVAPVEGRYQVLEPVRVAVLDDRVTPRIGRFPEVMSGIVCRVMNRSRALAGHLVLAQMPRVDERLLVLFWHLADRWGRVTTDGVVLPLALSHEMLGALIGAQRPTVTLALKQLTERGMILRRPDRGWLLMQQPADYEASQPAAASAS